MNIKQEIEELKTRLEQLEAECKAAEESEWPKIGDKFFYILGDGRISDHTYDKDVKAIGNIFRTTQEAEAEVEARKVIAELRATEGRVGVFPDSPGYGVRTLSDCVVVSNQHTDFALVWKTEEQAQQAIDKVGEARIIAAVKHFGRV